MSSITIRKIGITALDTDVVVNAANEGLQAGGGVCGAIFRAAGHRQLQEACDEIGFCRLTSRDVVRHPLVQKIVDAYDKYEKKEEHRANRAKEHLKRRRYQRKERNDG